MSEELCIFGEVLFDVFPDGNQVLGGAPFNVAWHLQAFGQSPFFISRVGNDPQGNKIRQAMLDWGMDTSALQTDDNLPTGFVNIELIDGEPSYDIVEPSAYDNIDPASLENSCRVLYHGSLALRNNQSEKALHHLLSTDPPLVFIDVNLRSPWWRKESVREMLRQAHWAKLNTEELDLLYPSDKETRQQLTDFISEYDLQGAVLTHAEKGAELLTSDNEHYSVQPSKSLIITDTVGAGDAFTSVVITGLKNNWPLSATIQRAQQFASAIVQQRGAIVNNQAFYLDFLKDWELI